MAGTYTVNGPSKTNQKAIRLETYGNQTSRKTKTMARRCHGRSKKEKKKKTGRRQLRIEELEETWLRKKPTKGCSAK
jgi:hypothetical protein